MGRVVGGGNGMGKTCKLKDVSFQCMTKFTTKKIIIKPLEYSKKNHQSKVRRNYFGEIFHLGNYDTCKNSSILILRTQWLFRKDFAK